MKRSDKYSQFFANIGSAEMENAVSEIVEDIRKKLPQDEGVSSHELQLVDNEIIEYLKKYQSGKRSKKQLDGN